MSMYWRGRRDGILIGFGVGVSVSAAVVAVLSTVFS